VCSLIGGIVAMRECVAQPPWDATLIDTAMLSLSRSVRRV
jgi:hypothetical protein